ncbi:MAG: choice-of-anchor D domain-containing protein [Myxococcaceae bacterium]|nr:choice-of-anchor D domain-containing protein [Myxococcaceae bacterium]
MKLSRLVALVAALAAPAAFATHPTLPINLTQKVNGVSIPVGGNVNAGSTITLTADNTSDTCGSGYRMEFEIRPIGTSFSNTPTHFSSPYSPACTTTGNTGTATVSGLSAGTYHWQVRLNTGFGTSSWVGFNSGAIAFIVAGATVAPTSLSFGNVKVGTTSPSQSVTFTNNGSTPVTFTSASATAPFVVDNAPAPGTSVPAGGSAIISVAAAPTATGPVSGTLTITTSAPNSPHTVSLSVNGSAPLISVTPSSVNFGDSGINATPGQKTIIITNSGNVPLTIANGIATSPFGAPPMAGDTIAAGGSKTYTLTFSPTVLGPATGTLTITSDSPLSPTVVQLAGNGVEPHLALSNTLIAFPDTVVGATSVSSTITATNTGSGSLHIFPPTISSPFTTTLAETTIPEGGSTTFTITFAPTAPGPITGSIVVVSDDADGPHTINLAGTARAPKLAAAPVSVSFGSVALGVPQNQVLTLTNAGDAAVTVLSATLSGSAASDYSLVGAPATPFSIPANGGSLQLTVRFLPTGVGARSATLTFASNAWPNGTVTVPLSGSGDGAMAAINPTSLNFTQVNLGASAVRTFNITNSGNQPLVVSGISFSGSAAVDFSTPQTTPFTVTAGASQTVTIQFNPTLVGQRNATATVASNDPLNPGLQVSLAGEGIAPNISASPLSLNFGQVRVGQQAQLPVTVQNSGSGPLTISGLTFTGSDASRFSYANVGTPFTIPAGGAPQTFQVVFTPNAVGIASANLVIASDDPDTKSLQIPVTGEGIAPGISVSATSLNFGGQFVNRTSAPRTFEISNNGSAPLQVFSLSITGAASTSFTVVQPSTPFTVLPNSKQTVGVTLTPKNAGELSGRLFIQNDAPNGAMAHVDLIGLGMTEAFTVSPLTVDFGTVKAGQTSDTVNVVLQNQTADNLPLAPAVITGANASDFKVLPVPGSIGPGETINAVVTYTPAAAGTHTAELHLASTDAQIPMAVVLLTGNSVSRILEASPSAVDFGLVPKGKTVQQLVQISNKTSKTITIVGVSSTSPEFTVEASGLGPVEANRSIQLPVNFTPAAEHLAIGTLGINIEGAPAGSTELTIAVSGTGTKAEEVAQGCAVGGAVPLWSLMALAGAAFLRRRRAAR